MDEEELEQPSSKINLGSFFERVDSVEKVANNALSRANANLGIISNQKLIINSLNVTIEAMETKIRDIANYIIIEKKLEKDVEEDRALEEQDRLQKQAMVERATTIMGEPGPQGEPGQPAEQQGGGSSLLGSLLRLGIGAFALKFIWPALLPLLKGSLGALGKTVFTKLGTGIGVAVGGTLLSLPLLKRFKAPFQKKSEELGSGVGDFVAEKVNTIGEDGSVDTNLGGQVVSESNMDINDKNVENLEDTLEDKDLIPAYEKNRKNKGNTNKNKNEKNIEKNSVEDKDMSTDDDTSMGTPEPGDFYVTKGGQGNKQTFYHVLQPDGKIKSIGKREPNEGSEFSRSDIEAKSNVIKAQNIEDVSNDKIEAVNNNSKIEVETKNKNLDLSTNDIDSDTTQAIAKTNERIDNLIGGENKEQNNGNLVSANKPNVTEATLKLASAPLPFVKVIKNNQLSTSPKSYNGLPPEIAAMIS